MADELIIKDTHRGLRYEDGVLTGVLGAGRYSLPPKRSSWFFRQPVVEIVLVDIRERDLTIKGQEILTADKVALRVSIVVLFRVSDPQAALTAVANYEDRLYSDVQLAARRSLASSTLEEILTNRNRLSEDILRDVQGSAAGYGVTIQRADVKDLVFPGNLQEVMNKVLAAERVSQAQLVEARTRASVQQIEAEAKAATRRTEALASADAERAAAQAEAERQQVRTTAEIAALAQRAAAAAAYRDHPALLRLRELETLGELAKNANARLNISLDSARRDDAEA